MTKLIHGLDRDEIISLVYGSISGRGKRSDGDFTVDPLLSRQETLRAICERRDSRSNNSGNSKKGE